MGTLIEDLKTSHLNDRRNSDNFEVEKTPNKQDRDCVSLC